MPPAAAPSAPPGASAAARRDAGLVGGVEGAPLPAAAPSPPPRSWRCPAPGCGGTCATAGLLLCPHRPDTPEAATARAFLAAAARGSAPLNGGGLLRAAAAVARAPPPPRVRPCPTAVAAAWARGGGGGGGASPVVVSPALSPLPPASPTSPHPPWPPCLDASTPLTVENLAARWPRAAVTANDRAPARQADADAGRPQATAGCSLADFVAYCRTAAAISAGAADPHAPAPSPAPGAPPFYANGWGLWGAAAPGAALPAPAPPWMVSLDATATVLEALHGALGAAASAAATAAPAGSPPAAAAASAGAAWAASVRRSLFKLFIGPAGTVTRLHQDAGAAHGWLLQLEGTKLLLLYPPGCSALRAHLMPGNQCGLDPLAACDGGANTSSSSSPSLSSSSSAAACCSAVVLGPGEALLLPSGWWHYAVAVDGPSLTLQCNFYDATNTHGLVQLMLGSRAQARAAAAAQQQQLRGR